MIEVLVTGAYGRMGRESAKAVWNAEDMVLTGAVDRQGGGSDIGQIIESGRTGIIIEDNLEDFLKRKRPDVAIDYTGPQAVYQNTLKYLEHGVRPIIGATGLDARQINDIIELSEKKGIGGLIAPNFAIGAILMMRFAAEAVRFLPHVEIIEMHHDQKIDAPSGTAIKTSSSRGCLLSWRRSLAPAAVSITAASASTVSGCRDWWRTRKLSWADSVKL
jgi:4-hydroxy-tetrahydrodipicolinate reductase